MEIKVPEIPVFPGESEEQVNARRQRYMRTLRDYAWQNEVALPGQTVLVGSSLMEFFPVNELMQTHRIPGIVYDRGLAGYTTQMLLEVMDDIILPLKPSKVVINIGTNDLGMPGDSMGKLIENYRTILKKILDCVPECQITMLAYYPSTKKANEMPARGDRKPRTLQLIDEANERVKALAEEMGLTFVDINEPLKDENGYLRDDYSSDGTIHINAKGYDAIIELMKPYF